MPKIILLECLNRLNVLYLSTYLLRILCNLISKYCVSTNSLTFLERVADMGTECMSANGMNRELRSGSLNHYLSEMIRCLAAVARPRYV